MPQNEPKPVPDVGGREEGRWSSYVEQYPRLPGTALPYVQPNQPYVAPAPPFSIQPEPLPRIAAALERIATALEARPPWRDART